MNKNDLKEIKGIVDSALETHLASVHEEISDGRREVAEVKSELSEEIDEVDTRLSVKIDGVATRLGAFENNEVDKRKQLKVRVTRVEKHLNLSKPST